MTSTLFQVMQRVQRFVVPAELAISAAATGGSTTTVADAVYLAGGASRGTGLFEFLWLALFHSASMYPRRVIEGGDNETTGTLTYAPAAGTAIVANDTYQTWTFDPSLVVAAIDTALRRMEYVERIPLTVVSNRYLYSLATDAAWVERRGQFLGLEWQATGVTPTPVPLDVSSWQLSQDRGVFTLQLPRSYTAGSDTVTLVTLRSYLSLDGTPQGATTHLAPQNAAWTTTAPLEWLAAEAALELLEQPVTRRVVATRQAEYEQALREARAVAARYRADNQPDVPRRAFARSAFAYDPALRLL